jgi:hypothetical protein
MNAADVVAGSLRAARSARIVEMSFGSVKKIRVDPRIDTIRITNRSRGASETLDHLKGDLKVLQRGRFPILLT